MSISIGIFIHNEERHIESLLKDLFSQSIFQKQKFNIQVYLLCNGCTDNSVQISLDFSKLNNCKVLDWPEGGKSHTWNKFVHHIISEDTQTIIFIDGDLRLPDSNALERLVTELNSTLSLTPVVTSKPVKNTLIYSRWNPLRIIASVIKSPHKDGSVCGQLYAMEADFARKVWLPNPCLCEDGYLAAATITNLFQDAPKVERVRAVPEVWHSFEPPKNLSEFFQHDVRLSLGGELNAALYTQLWNTKDFIEAQQLMQEFSAGNKIDFAILEHLKNPKNHFLQFKRVLHYAWPRGQRLIKGLFLFPIRFAHMVYMAFVYKSARRYFSSSVFKW